MKAIQSGNQFRIFNNDMKTYDQIPAQTYLVEFSKEIGFYMSLYQEIHINEKVYGIHEQKVSKVLNSFKIFNRNLGVILSGERGIGKTLFAKILASKAVEQGYPLIIVNTYFPGIAEYLNTIDQEVIILFDEFDKTFKSGDNFDPQTEMLTLFDGVAQGKKLFVVTCNDLRGLNDYLVNRPGRFHYHFRFEYPTTEEIKVYMRDKLPPKRYCDEIDKIISFSQRVPLNYDCLRAIAFEMYWNEVGFEESIKDLNILNLNNETYNIIVELSNGERLRRSNITLNLFNEDIERTYELEDPETRMDLCYIHFNPADNYYDSKLGKCVIDGHNVKFELESYLEPDNDEDDSKTARLWRKYKDVTVESLVFIRHDSRDLHYVL